MNFDDATHEIETAYCNLNQKMGWRFLCVSRKVLDSNPEIALITLNPGGDHIPVGHGVDSCENGCAYLSEQWGDASAGQNDLQIQVQELFKIIREKTNKTEDFRSLMEKSLIAYYVPFRSPDIESLARKDESFKFAKSLWRRLFQKINPKLIVTIDKDSFHNINSIILEKFGQPPKWHETKETGWGRISSEVIRYQNSFIDTTLVRLPHLSRFGLFTGPNYPARKPYIDAIFNRACQYL